MLKIVKEDDEKKAAAKEKKDKEDAENKKTEDADKAEKDKECADKKERNAREADVEKEVEAVHKETLAKHKAGAKPGADAKLEKILNTATK